MNYQDPLFLSRLTPPRLPHCALVRPALAARLREALSYRLTVLHAGTGYGKTTALTALAQEGVPVFWHSLSETDVDPQRFLEHLIAAIRRVLPDLATMPHTVLQEISQHGGTAWDPVMDVLLNALAEHPGRPRPAILVFDDFHIVAHLPEVLALTERLIAGAPAGLHIVLASRSAVHLGALAAGRARGDVLELTREVLRFTPTEIAQVCETTYGLTLTAEEVRLVDGRTDGWPSAVQLVALSLREGASLRELLAAAPASAAPGTLFTHLARAALERQPAARAEFMYTTALLRDLTPAACDAITGGSDGAARLDELYCANLGVIALGDAYYRYHYLWHEVLRKQWGGDPAGARALHRQAAEHFQQAEQYEAATHHWLAAEAYDEVAESLVRAGAEALRAGRVASVSLWLDACPPRVLAESPALQFLSGEVHRLRNRFDEALRWYVAAESGWRAAQVPLEVGQALRGQALVHLEMMRPQEVERVLVDALAVLGPEAEGETRARLWDLMAENRLAQGQPEAAEEAGQTARALRGGAPTYGVLEVRARLRAGRLGEARAALVAWAEAERGAVEQGDWRALRAHRERVLLLALIEAFRGAADATLALAEEALALGEQSGSPFAQVTAYVRLGHAWQLQPGGAARAITHYQTAMALEERLEVRRARAEALFGLTRAYSLLGAHASAAEAAEEGRALCRVSGDRWWGALVALADGAGLVQAGQPEAARASLQETRSAFQACRDTLGETVAGLWLSLVTEGGAERAQVVDEVLAACETNGYGFLFTQPTLLGLADPRRTLPLLRAARTRQTHSAYVERLLSALGPD